MEYGYDQSILIRPEADDSDDDCKTIHYLFLSGIDLHLPALTLSVRERSHFLPDQQLQRRPALHLATC
jgi:hypothetical protein